MKKYIVAALVIGATAFSVIGPFPGGSSGSGGITSLTGDVTATGPGSSAATLSTVNGNVGSFTNSNITVNAKGLITAASSGSAISGFNYLSGNTSVYGGTNSTLIFAGANNTITGVAAGTALTSGIGNTGFGKNALLSTNTGGMNTTIGNGGLSSNTTGQENTGVGAAALGSNIVGSRNVAIGLAAGYYELGSDSFYVNNLLQNNTAGDKAFSLLYGKFSGSLADLTGQQLTVNGTLNANGNVIQSSGNSHTLTGSVSGTIAQSAANTTTPYAIKWPAAQGAAATALTNDGSGNLSWATTATAPGGSTTQVQYNNAGVFAGSSKFTFTEPAPQLLIDGDGFSSSLSAFNTAVGLTYNTITAATLGSHHANIQADDTVNGPTLDNYTSRGTFASPTQHLSGDTLGGVFAVPWDGTGTFSSGFASFKGLMGMVLLASENHTTTAMGSKIDFYTTPNGATVPVIPLTLGGSTAAVSANNGTGTADMLRLNNNGVVGLRFTDSNELIIAEDGTPANKSTEKVSGAYNYHTMNGATNNFFIQAGDQTDASIVLATAATAKSLTITQNSDGSVTLLQNSNGAIKPGTNASMDFGASTEAFRKIYASTGTAASPTYSFGQAAGQEDNGMWLSGTDQLGFSTAGVDRWDISSAGHLLCAADGVYDIGASSGNRPATIRATSALILGTAADASDASVNVLSNSRLALRSPLSNGEIRFDVGGSTRMYLTQFDSNTLSHLTDVIFEPSLDNTLDFGKNVNTLGRPRNVYIGTSVVLETKDTTEVGSVTTSNATQTTAFTKAMLDNTVYECEADIAARRTDAADRAGYKIMVTAYREAAGGCTIQGTVDSAHAAESDASWDATFTCSGNDLLVSVTGAAAKTVDWTSTVHCKYAQ